MLIKLDGWVCEWALSILIYECTKSSHPQKKAHFQVWICINYTTLRFSTEPTLVCGLWRPLSSSLACALRTIDIRRRTALNQATQVCRDGVCSSVEGHDIPGWGGISDIILDIYKDAELTWLLSAMLEACYWPAGSPRLLSQSLSHRGLALVGQSKLAQVGCLRFRVVTTPKPVELEWVVLMFCLSDTLHLMCYDGSSLLLSTSGIPHVTSLWLRCLYLKLFVLAVKQLKISCLRYSKVQWRTNNP